MTGDLEISEQEPKISSVRSLPAGLRYAFLTLILTTVALFSALAAMRVAIHGREVVVPSLIGMTEVEAERAVADSGLTLEVESQFYSSDIPAGKIVNQVPGAGATVRRGWHLRVAESLGPQRIAIPDVVGQTERVAEFNIRRRGMQMGVVATVDVPGETPGQIVAQNPLPTATSVASPKLNVLVAGASEPQAYVMPNFAGQPLGSVMLAIKDAGLHAGTVTSAAGAPNDTTPAMPPGPGSFVLSHDPAPGQRVLAGAAVNFEVSR